MKKAILTVFLCLATIGITQAKRAHIIMRIPMMMLHHLQEAVTSDIN